MRRLVRVVCVSTALGVLCGADLYASAQSKNTAVSPQILDHPLSEDEWETLIETAPFFDGYRHPLTHDEKCTIASAHALLSLPASKINRSMAEFEGDQLVMGTGWALAKTSIVGQLGDETPIPEDYLTVYQARTMGELGLLGRQITDCAEVMFHRLYADTLAGHLKLTIALEEAGELVRHLDMGTAQGFLEDLQRDARWSAVDPNHLSATGEAETYTALVTAFTMALQVKRGTPPRPVQSHALEELTGKWYTVDVSCEARPDLVGSVTCEEHMSVLPSARFARVIYEHLPWAVYLHPATLRIAQRVTKPGGRIDFGVAQSGRRLVAYMLHKSAWQGDAQITKLLEGSLGRGGIDVVLRP